MKHRHVCDHISYHCCWSCLCSSLVCLSSGIL